jgi:predicted RNA-binding Zn ribbon-like protein
MAHAATDYDAPMLGEPLPLELANTTHAVRGRLRDGLQTTEHLVAWLTRVRSRLQIPLSDEDLRAVDDAQLTLARDLRDCLRELARAATDGLETQAELIDRLNRHARAAPRWRELRWDDHPHTETCSEAPAINAAIGEIAEAGVDLFSSSERASIQPCRAPGCVLYFLRDHPRREWCSIGCGNRVRAARHYERRRNQQR